MINIIRECAEAHNLIFGICDGRDLDMELFGDVCDIPFFHGESLDRISPKRFLDNAGSVIVIGSKIEHKPIVKGLDYIMAPSLSGGDYHRKLQALAKGLACAMNKQIKFNYRIQVDSGPLMEVAFAVKAGMGFAGMNKSIISEKFGGFFNIGLIVTDLEIAEIFALDGGNNAQICTEPHKSERKCPKSCGKCTKSCPTGALGDDGSFNYEKCISYITQKKGVLSEAEMMAMGVTIYGCDICRSVCPGNSSGFAAQGDFSEKTELLHRILAMGKKEFENTFGGSNFFWRGKTTIQRNCLIALYNLGGEAAVDIIRAYAGNSNEILSSTAKKLIEMA